MSYPKLRGAIREKYGKQEHFARAIPMNPASLSLKLNKRREWTGTEIERVCELLGIPLEEAHRYFFYD